MAAQTEIAWCDSTFNPWWGCTKVSPGCDNCYAERDAHRFGTEWGASAPRRVFGDVHWRQPEMWNAQPFVQCHACGWRGAKRALVFDHEFGTHCCPGCDLSSAITPARRRVFCASMADVFDNDAPEGQRERLFALIDATPNLDWLLLTKRIGNVWKMIPDRWSVSLPRNVWLGATVVTQAEVERDIPKLLGIKAHTRFLSIEPMLGPIDLDMGWRNDTGRWDADGRVLPLRKIDWVIAGGESGSRARPMHPDWVRDLREQCIRDSVPFLFKQWGEWTPGENAGSTLSRRMVDTANWFNGEWDFARIHGDDEFDIRDEPTLYRAGKKSAGRKLDGVVHDAFPT